MPGAVAFTTADLTVATIAYHDVTGLSFAVAGGIAYAFEFNLIVHAAATTTGHQAAVNGPSSPTLLRYQVHIPVPVANPQTAAENVYSTNVYDHALPVPATTASQTATAPFVTRVRGFIIPATTGTLIARIKPEVAANLIVQRGSWGVLAAA